MNLLTAVLIYWISTVKCSPIPSNFVQSPSITRQYLVLTPQSQLQLQPAIKLHQPVMHQIEPLQKFEPMKGEYLLLNQNAPITDYSLFALKQEEGGGGGVWTNLQSFFQNIGSFGQQQESVTIKPESAQEGDNKKACSEQIQTEVDAEAIPTGKSPIKPPPLESKFYTISGQPQFYGNFDAFRGAINPVISFQLLQPIKQRQIEPVIARNTEPQLEIQPSGISDNNLKFKSELDSPIQHVTIQSAEPAESAENVQIPGEAAQQFARFLSETRSRIDNAQQQSEDRSILNSRISESIRNNYDDDDGESEDEPSIALARPAGVAVAGLGGVASSAPKATALTGEGGLSLASPIATAISGDLSNSDDE